MAAEAAPTEARWQRVAWFAAAALLALWGLWQARDFFHDDAFITLRYVARWLAGRGPTWNDGEHVEGYSHPLWMLQLTALGLTGASLVDAARALGVVYLVALFALWWRSRAWAVPLVLAATTPGLLLWTRGGLEGVSFTFWLCLGAWLVTRALAAAAGDARRAGALAGAALAAAALTRPEGALLGPLALLWLLLGRAPRRTWLALLASFALPLLVWQAVRLGYYGDWLPNVARVKLGAPLAVQLGAALRYLRFNLRAWLPALAVAAALLVLARRPRALWPALLALPMLLTTLSGGGDHMPGVRLVMPALVLLAFTAGLAGPPRQRWARLAASALVVGAALLQVAPLLGHRVPPDAAAAVGSQVGRYLEAHLPPGALVVTATAGSTPYHAPHLAFIDSLGLNDRHIARRAVPHRLTLLQVLPGHRKGDGAYVLSREPDVVIIGPAEGDLGRDPRGWFLGDLELLTAPAFQAHYRPYGFMVRRGLTLIAYLRDDSLAAQQLGNEGAAMQAPWDSW